jgi:hypothetical protein
VAAASFRRASRIAPQGVATRRGFRVSVIGASCCCAGGETTDRRCVRAPRVVKLTLISCLPTPRPSIALTLGAISFVDLNPRGATCAHRRCRRPNPDYL